MLITGRNLLRPAIARDRRVTDGRSRCAGGQYCIRPARDLPYLQNPLLYANTLAKIGIVTFLLLIIVAWPRRQKIIEAHNTATFKSALKFYLGGNIVTLCHFTLGQICSFEDSGAILIPIDACSCLLLATGASIALVAAPLSFGRHLLKLAPSEIAVAFAGASIAVGTGRLAQQGWNSLSSATFTLSHWFLTLYEPNVLLDNEQRILGSVTFAFRSWSLLGL